MRKVRRLLKVVEGQVIKAKSWFVDQEQGEGFVDVLVKMLIVVVVGAALLAIMRAAIPNLFTGMMDKIKAIFEV